MKVCKKCGEDKPLSEFGKRKRSKDGLRFDCKSCVSAYNRSYRESNPEQVLAAKKAYYEVLSKAPEHTCETSGCDQLSKVCSKCGEDKPLSEYGKHKTGKDGHRPTCKVCHSAANKAYREANRGERNAYNKAYREANREKLAAREKAYHAEKWANDPEYRARLTARNIRRERMLASAVQEPYLREDIFERDGWTCQLCQEPIDPELQWPESGFASIDHIVPISHGGDDTPANVQAAHLSCNTAKGNRVELEDLQAA